MATQPRDQIPRMADLLAPAVDALLGDLVGTRRAARERHANHGRYGDLLRGWQAQAAVWRARLVREVIARRLSLASGTALTDLAKSEFFAELPPDPQFAVGEVLLSRIAINTNPAATTPMGGVPNFTYGVIPVGVRFKRAADPRYIVPLQEAEYAVTEAVVCGTDDNYSTPFAIGDGTFRHYQVFTVQVTAAATGTHANVPVFSEIPIPDLTISTPLFDSTFSADRINAAGGSSGVVDDQIAALALAMARGSAGPTKGATVAGALTNPSARRALYVDDPVTAIGKLFVADPSWASSAKFRALLKQSLLDKPWIGWGCRVDVFGVLNQGIVVKANILLRGSQYNASTGAITTAVKNALIDYFDNRPDWYTWRLDAIGGVVAGADLRILACTSVAVVTDTGTLIAAVDESNIITGTEPPAALLGSALSVTHYELVRQVIDATYSVPS